MRSPTSLMLDRRRLLIGAGATAAALATRPWTALAAGETIAATRAGKLRGAIVNGVHTFLGVPYAAPPVGELRLASPRAVAAWQGERDATKPGNAPVQTLGGAGTWLYEGAEPQGEDCLSLNVWTPTLGGNRPVMVWMYGGAWRIGHASVAAADGRNLARTGDVVVVAMNYRLGAAGWLAHPDLRDRETGAAANWGLQDQIAALAWVKDNIANFGGDPGNVTIFGESAGGTTVVLIAQNERSAGLCHKVIAQSPALFTEPSFVDLKEAAGYAEAVAARFNTKVAGLRGVPAAQLHMAELQEARARATPARIEPFYVAPVRDDLIVREWPRSNDKLAVPLLIGNNRDEGKFWFDLVQPSGQPVPGLKPPADDAALADQVGLLIKFMYPQTAKLAAADVISAYRSAIGQRGGSTAIKDVFSEIYSDTLFRMQLTQLAARQNKRNRPAYVYEFAQPLKPPGRGTPHTAEVAYVFGNNAHPFFAAKLGDGPAENAIARTTMEIWSTFARTGKPETAATGAWPVYTAEKRAVGIIGGEKPFRIETAPRDAELRVWDALYRV
jgi:para-nitrobenzyl esterase